MSFRSWCVSSAGLLGALIAMAPQSASAHPGHHYLIEPGQTRVFMCGWGYGPIAHEHALHVNDARLRPRRITHPSPGSVRVSFQHKVTAREDSGRYRTIVNRGNQRITYRDDCPGGGAN